MKYSDVQVEKIVYNKTPKKNDNEKHSYVGIFYPKKEENKYGKLAFFTPKLQCSFTENYVHFFIPASEKKDPFYKFVLGVDQMNVHTASENSEDWFGTDLLDEDVQDKYKYSVKVGDMSQHGRVFSSKVRKNDKDESMLKVYNHKKELCDVSSVDKKEVVALVELDRLVFSKHTYKAEWVVHQLKIYEPKEVKEPDPEPEPEPEPTKPEFEESFSNNDELLDYDDDSD